MTGLNRGEKIALALFALFCGLTLIWAVKTSRPGIAVSAPAEQSAELTGADGETSDELAPDEKVNINTASAAELQKLPGVGEILAGRIVEYRRENGGFAAAEDIMKVDGVGRGKFDAMKQHIAVDAQGGSA